MKIALLPALALAALALAGCFTAEDCQVAGVLVNAGAAVTGDVAGRNDAQNAQKIATVVGDACPGVVAAGALAGRALAAKSAK